MKNVQGEVGEESSSFVRSLSGDRLYYLADRAGLTGSFSPIHLQKLEQAFPLFIEQLENMLRSGELNPHQQRQVNIQLTSLTCIADTRSSCGYVYLTIYPAP